MESRLLFTTGLGVMIKNNPVGLGIKVYQDETKLFGIRIEKIKDLKSYIR